MWVPTTSLACSLVEMRASLYSRGSWEAGRAVANGGCAVVDLNPVANLPEATTGHRTSEVVAGMEYADEVASPLLPLSKDLVVFGLVARKTLMSPHVVVVEDKKSCKQLVGR